MQTSFVPIEAAIPEIELQNQLRQKEITLELMEALSGAGSWTFDFIQEKVFWSDNVFRICGYIPQSFEPTFEIAYGLVHPDDLARMQAAIQHTLETGAVYDIKKRLIRQDGEVITITSRGVPEFDDNGKIVRLVGTLQDITRRVKTEEALLDGIQRYNLTLEGAMEGLWEWDIASGTAFFSPRFKEMFGIEPNNSDDGIHFFERKIHPEDRDPVLKALVLHFKHNDPFFQEMRLRDIHGVYRHYLVRAQASWNESGRAVRMAGSVSDITDQKKENKLLQDAVNLASIGSWEIDIVQQKVFIPEATRQILELDEQFEIGLHNIMYFFPEGESRDSLTKQLMHILQNGAPFTDMELNLFTGKGNLKWMRITAQTEWDGANPVRLFGLIQNITEKKRADQQLVQLLDEKSAILESITDGFCTVNRDWVVTYWNRAAETISTLPRNLIVGFNLWYVYGDASESRFKVEYHRAMNDHIPVHFEEYFPMIEKWIEISAYPSEYGLSIYFKDITENKHLTNLLQLEQKVLELNIRRNSKIEDTITFCLKAMEQLHPGMHCTIQKVDQGQLLNWIDVSMPPAYIKQVNEIPIGPNMGSCGTAAFLKQKIIASDISTDPRWSNFKSIIEPFGLKACWSFPIFGSQEEVVGTLAMYFNKVKSPNKAENQTIERMRHILQVIIENKTIEQNLKRSNERYEHATRATSDAIWDWDLNTKILYWGSSYSKLFGPEQEPGKTALQTWMDRVHPDDRERVVSNIFEHIESQKDVWIDSYRLMKPNGSYAHVIDKGVVIRDDSGQPLRMIGALQDVTRQKMEERRMKLLESVIIHAQDAIMLMDYKDEHVSEAKIYYVNDSFSNISGYTRKEIIGKNPAIIAGTHSDQSDLQQAIEILKQGKSVELETICHRKYGEKFWAHINLIPIPANPGEPFYAIAFFRDISARKMAEAEKDTFYKILRSIHLHERLEDGLTEAAMHLTQFMDAKYAEVWSINFNHSALVYKAGWPLDSQYSAMAFSVNEKEVILGVGMVGTAIEKRNMVYWEYLLQKPFRRKFVAAALDLHYGLSIPVFFKDEIIAVFCVFDSNPIPKVYLESDLLDKISHQLGADIQKFKTDKEFSHFFTLTPDVMCILNDSSYFKKVNPALERILGFTEEEILGRPIQFFIHPEDKQEFDVSNLNTKDVLEFENRFVTKSGTVVWLEWKMVYMQSERLIFAVAKDISQKRLMDAEKKHLIEVLTNNNRELKQFSYITSHNLRAPLTNMLSVFDLLDMDHIANQETALLLDALKKSTYHLNQTLNDLIDILIVKGNTNLSIRPLQLSNTFIQVSNSIHHLIEESGARIETNFEKAPFVTFNSEYLESIFLNMLTNSIKYTKPGIPPEIKIYSYSDNTNIYLIFEDQGLGIDLEKVKDRIFGLYQKFHPHKDSKGIGLYLVHAQVTALGGSISVESKVMEGTRFSIRFKKLPE